jgi:methylmalonyl-CoA/ethylmalonyl-CoA epimerase
MDEPRPPLRIEHVGIAVRDLPAAITRYEQLLSSRCYAVEEVTDQQVRTAFFRIGDSKIELLASTTPDGPIARFIERRGEGIHHIALNVEGLQLRLDGMAAQGMELIDRHPRTGAEGFRIAFVHPRAAHGVLLELCESGTGGEATRGKEHHAF